MEDEIELHEPLNLEVEKETEEPEPEAYDDSDEADSGQGSSNDEEDEDELTGGTGFRNSLLIANEHSGLKISLNSSTSSMPLLVSWAEYLKKTFFDDNGKKNKKGQEYLG